jgi:hypothetical protein
MSGRISGMFRSSKLRVRPPVRPENRAQRLRQVEEQEDQPFCSLFQEEEQKQPVQGVEVAERNVPLAEFDSVLDHQNEFAEPAELLPAGPMAFRTKRVRNYAAPVALGASTSYSKKNANFSFSGREYIKDLIPVSKVFNSERIILRPTDSQLFSWLCGIAAKFEKYKFTYLALHYEAQISAQASGVVGLFFDPDPTDAKPCDWNTFVSTGVNVHGTSWGSHHLVIPPSLFSRKLQTSSEFPDAYLAPPLSQDPHEYFSGQIGWVSHGIDRDSDGKADENADVAGMPIGKLYLDYHLVLETRCMDSDPRTNLLADPLLKTVSASVARNSGSGMYMRLNTFPAVSTIQIPFGNGANLQVHHPTSAGFVCTGSQYFNTYGGVWVARQNLHLYYSVHYTIAGAETIVANGGVLWSVKRAVVNGGSGAFADQYGPSGQLTVGGAVIARRTFEVGAGAGSGMSAGTINLLAGDEVGMSCTFSGDDTFSLFEMYLLPCTYDLDRE